MVSTEAIAGSSNVESALTSLNNNLNWHNRRIISIADSYGGSPTVDTSWQHYLSLYIGSDNELINFYEGSAGIYHIGNGGHNAQTLLSSNESNVPDKETITDIVIGMGINDYSDSDANIRSAYNSLITYIKNTYPNAITWFCWTGNSRLQSYSTTISHIDIMKTKALGSEGCRFIDGIQYIMHDARCVGSDAVHPTAVGSQEIAKGIAYGLKHNGHYRYLQYGTCTLKPSAGGSTTMQVLIDNETTYVYFPDTYCTSSFTFTANSYATWGSIENPIVYFYDYLPTIAIPIYSNTASYQHVLSMCFTNGTTVKVRCNAAGTISGIQINTSSFSIPTLMTK